LTLGRNVVAWDVPAYVTHKRDTARMSGHPPGGDGRYHRGHLMSHTTGGGTDINLVPQLGSLNIGNFRKLDGWFAAWRNRTDAASTLRGPSMRMPAR
jgi:hypothetical protein